MTRSLLGDEPAGPDYIMVKGGLTGFWRAEVHIMRGPGRTSLQVKPGGDPVYSRIGVARKVGRALHRTPPLTPASARERRQAQQVAGVLIARVKRALLCASACLALSLQPGIRARRCYRLRPGAEAMLPVTRVTQAGIERPLQHGESPCRAGAGGQPLCPPVLARRLLLSLSWLLEPRWSFDRVFEPRALRGTEHRQGGLEITLVVVGARPVLAAPFADGSRSSRAPAPPGPA